MSLKDKQGFVRFVKALKFIEAVTTRDMQKRAATKSGGLTEFKYTGGYYENSN